MTFMASITKGETRDRDAIERLRKEVREGLASIVGEQWVSDDPMVMDTYAWQYVAEAVAGSNYMERPLAVALPASAQEVAEIVKLCNRLEIQYKACSTGFGMWNSAIHPDSMVQIDLKRMNRIIKIDRKNMYAVVEPYVTSNELQVEAMKLGLNTHIAGVGAQASALAGATSMMGQGWDGVSMGFSGRNLLGCEWVTPDGEIVQVGSFDQSGEYFAGEGPFFSFRGVFRGFGGAMGGLGVFTRCAVKLYPWYGPARITHEGASPDYRTVIPENHASAWLTVRGWEGMAELGYRLGEAEVCTLLGRNAPSLASAVITTDNQEMVKLYSIPLMHDLYYSLISIITGQDREDFRYRMKVHKKILRELKGGAFFSGVGPTQVYWIARMMNALRSEIGIIPIIKSIPTFVAKLSRDIWKLGFTRGLGAIMALSYQALVYSGMNMRGVFRFGGTFWTAMGALVSWDNAIRGAKVGAQIKKKYIDEKIIFDDGGDNAWGGLYEGGCYGHLEELCCYDPTDDTCRERVMEYIIETNLACLKYACGDSLNAIGPPCHALYSPKCYDYDRWQQAIKQALDPNNAACANMYTDPHFAENLSEHQVRSMQRATGSPARVEIDGPGSEGWKPGM